MLLYQVWATKSTEIPLVGQFKRPRKLLFLDAGLVNHQMGIQGDFLNLKDLAGLYRGRIAEQVVGQNILAQFMYSLPKVLYWAREKTEGIAEVDFCLQHKGRILGIEVKSAAANKLKSLFSFAQAVPNPRLTRICGGQLKEEKIGISGKSFGLLSIPFYLVSRMLEDW
jgi:predicted AAA+ superfamily ATPase